ncbi:hypothetical protein AK812_SmicGene3931 [Symbiodinium microadriaticum]|uniref:Pentatricopeptide repeat-containing protein, chloroplastic n=1 Tax=Symbiodinium microadriaticum TaxID=2951 RepID=A0A1Q9EXI6_SYMMI|nr:hypothetical protein AK812_SmicGene3931 [Symbiodinium microadriaticum]
MWRPLPAPGPERSKQEDIGRLIYRNQEVVSRLNCRSKQTVRWNLHRDDAVRLSRLITAAGRLRDWREALRLLEGSASLSIRRNAVLFTSAMQSCVSSQQWPAALATELSMRHAGVKPDSVASNTLLNAGSRFSNWPFALCILEPLCETDGALEDRRLLGLEATAVMEHEPEERRPLVRRAAGQKGRVKEFCELPQVLAEVGRESLRSSTIRASPKILSSQRALRCSWFSADSKRQFVLDSAVPEALSLAAYGLPFLIPEGEIQSLDAFLHTGFYAVGVVSFIAAGLVLHLKRNLGATMAATASGLRGVLLAVCNAWFLFGICPDGYTDDDTAVIFSIKLFAGYWTCVVLGSIFALLVYIVATEMTHEVPKILRLFVEFLETDKSNDYGQARVTWKDVHIRSHTIVPCTLNGYGIPIAVQAGGPQHPQHSADLEWRVLDRTQCLFSERRRQLDRRLTQSIKRSGPFLRAERLDDWVLHGSVGPASIYTWSFLESNFRSLMCYLSERIQGIWAVAELTKTEARSEKHVALIKVVKAHFLPIVDMVEELLVSVVSVDSLVHFTSADAERVRVLKDKIHEAKGRFREVLQHRGDMIKSMLLQLKRLFLASCAGVKTEMSDELSKPTFIGDSSAGLALRAAENESAFNTPALQAFWEERARIMAEQTDERSMRNSINELRVIHVVAFNMMMILRDFLEYATRAEQILRHHDGEAADLQKVVEHDWLGGLFQGIATFQNVRHVLRVVLSVMLGFFLGYCGGGGVDLVVFLERQLETSNVPELNQAIAKATATLLSKNQGSALFGQLIDTIFHRSITCRYADVNDLLFLGCSAWLGACFALFMYAADPEFDYYSYCQRSLLCNFAGGWQVTMFIRFHVSEFAIMGVQMANFGGQEMLVGSCGEERNMEAFDLGFQRGVGGVMDLWRSRANRGESVFQTARSVAFSRKPESLEALDSVTVNLLAIVFLVSVDLLFARERASVPRLRLSHGFMWLTTFQCILSRCKLWNVLAALDVEQPEVHFTRQEMLNMLAETESLGDEASSEPRYWRTEIHDVRYALSNLEYSMSVHGQNGALMLRFFPVEWLRIVILQGRGPREPGIAIAMNLAANEKLERKVLNVKPVFTHETCTRWSALDDKAAYTDFREEQWRIQSAVLTEMGDA